MSTAALLLNASLIAGCGWGYARRLEERDRPAPHTTPPAAQPRPSTPPPSPALRRAHPADPRIVPSARDLYTLGQNHRLSAGAKGPEQMSQHAFEVRLVDTVNDARRLIHCSTGTVIHAERRPPGAGVLAARTARGIPAGQWILEVDPSGLRRGMLNNDWYRHISKTHSLSFIGQAPDGVVTYRYLGPRARALAGP